MNTREIFRSRWGVTFTTAAGAFHSFRDLNLLPAEPPDFGSPPYDGSTTKVPAANGRLDWTEYFGFVTYDNREAVLRYYVSGSEARRASILDRAMNILHGRTAKIQADESPGFYYQGRLSVEPLEHAQGASILTVTGDLEPFKYALITAGQDWLWDPFSFETGVIRGYKSITIDGETTVTIVSSVLGGYPTITTSAAGMTVTHDGETYNLSKGKNALADIELPRGEEEVELVFDGSGTVSIDYRTGRL